MAGPKKHSPTGAVANWRTPRQTWRRSSIGCTWPESLRGGGPAFARMNDDQTVNEARLRGLSPLDGMKTANLSSLARKVILSEIPANRDLFRAGDTDRRTIWLVSG